MPIYEYRCASCGAELEKLQKISDPPLVECPECGKDSLTKLVSASSFRLKGSGWYETDFKTGKKKNGAGDNESAAPDSAKAVAADSGADTNAGGAGGTGGKSRGNDGGSDNSAGVRSVGTEAGKAASKGRDGAGTTAPKPAPKPAPKE